MFKKSSQNNNNVWLKTIMFSINEIIIIGLLSKCSVMRKIIVFEFNLPNKHCHTLTLLRCKDI